jgi:hypothetical protein
MREKNQVKCNKSILLLNIYSNCLISLKKIESTRRQKDEQI